MARMSGIDPREAGLFTRLLLGFARRKLAKLTGRAQVIEPLTITAHHPRLLLAQGQMEMGQEAARTIDARLKTLAHVRAAMRIGCPF